MNIRHLPRWQIVGRLKARRLRQIDIAHLAQVSPSLVCKVIARDIAASATTERVWRILETELTKEA